MQCIQGLLGGELQGGGLFFNKIIVTETGAMLHSTKVVKGHDDHCGMARFDPTSKRGIPFSDVKHFCEACAMEPKTTGPTFTVQVAVVCSTATGDVPANDMSKIDGWMIQHARDALMSWAEEKSPKQSATIIS